MEERFRIDGPRFEIARGTKDYPDVFEAVPEPPERLYVIGDPSALKEGLAVVGARKATPYGLNATKMLAGRAAELGVVVISGGARGCDAAAHEAALAAGGQTVAFLGGGCDEPYPKSNVDLFRHIVKGGRSGRFGVSVALSAEAFHVSQTQSPYRGVGARDAYRGGGASQRYILYGRRGPCRQ